MTRANVIRTVEHVDLQSYLGKWYEIARFDSWFERNCVNVTAEYSLLEHGVIGVYNSCRVGTPLGKYKSVSGRAIVVDTRSNAKLKVSFLPRILSCFDRFFSGDYWILKVASDYSVALVGDPSRNYLWILSRTPTLAPDIYNQYVESALQLGFDVKKLKTTQQQN